jgi:7-carboxy-7-deazaguanine synthase
MTDSALLQQRLLPLAQKPAGSLLIHEIYRSIQGESTCAGLPCVFVRTAVCDARCVWCDTPHAFTQGTVWSLEDVLSRVSEFRTPLVEITGGEPIVQPDVLPLMSQLADAGFTVLLETSGAHDLAKVDRRVHIIMDLKCPDSGECSNNRLANLDILKPSDEIKFVIASRSDFDWAADMIRRHGLAERFEVLMSAVFSTLSPRDLTDWLLAAGLQVRLQLQMHKYIWDPATRGV